jgi:tellurium resistance protein TerD
MSVSLVKGQKVNLTKEAGGHLTELLIGLGWDAKDSNVAGADFDLDASIFAVKSDGAGGEKVLSDKYFVFWGNLSSPDQSIVHHGDNLTGAGEGDDEQITVDVTKLPAEAEKLIVAVTIYDAEARNQNFGAVSNAIIRAEANGVELSTYPLDFEAALSTCVVFGELVKRSGEWHFSANSAEFPGGLEGLCNKYGIQVTHEPA